MRRALFATSPRVGQSWRNILAPSATYNGLTPDGAVTEFDGHSLRGYTETAISVHYLLIGATGASNFYAGQLYCQMVVNHTGVRDWVCMMAQITIGATPYYVYQWADIENRVLGVTTGSTLTILDAGVDDLGGDLSRVWFIAQVNGTVASAGIVFNTAEGDGDNTYLGDPELGQAIYAGEWMMLCEGDETVPYRVPG